MHLRALLNKINYYDRYHMVMFLVHHFVYIFGWYSVWKLFSFSLIEWYQHRFIHFYYFTIRIVNMIDILVLSNYCHYFLILKSSQILPAQITLKKTPSFSYISNILWGLTYLLAQDTPVSCTSLVLALDKSKEGRVGGRVGRVWRVVKGK